MGKLVANHAEGNEVVRNHMTRWVVVGLLNGAMVIAYFNRVNLSMAMTPMAEDFGWLASQQGLALSAFYWTYSPLQMPSGYLVDRFGARAPLAIGVLLWSLVSVATSLTDTLAGLVVIRLLLGISEAVVTPASMRYIRMHFEEKQRGLAIGLYLSGSKFGPALGFVVSAYLVEVFGWRWMFVILGLGGLVWLPPFLMSMKKDDVAAVPQKGRGNEPRGEQDQIVSLQAILRSPVMWGTFVGSFCYMYFVYYCITWMPAYLKQRYGMSITEQGWYSGFAFGGMSIVIVLAGWAADRLIAHGFDPVTVRKCFTIAGFLLATTQTLGAFTDSQTLALFFAVFSICGLGLTTANYWALTQTLIPRGNTGVVVGIQNTAANLPGIVAPWLTGWLVEKTGSFDAPILAAGVPLVVGIGCYLFLVRRKYAPRTGNA